MVIAVDGQEGVNMANSESPALILLDMSLPVMDGWEAARQLKSNPDTKDIPVLGLSAHAMTPDRDKPSMPVAMIMIPSPLISKA